MKKGQYQEEYEETYGIIIEDLKNKKTTEFVIEYYFLEDEDLNIFKAINKDRMNIQIHWEIDNKELKDKIDIQGSR